MNCPNCKSPLRPGSHFCSNCGLTLAQTPPGPSPSSYSSGGSAAPPQGQVPPPPQYQPPPGYAPTYPPPPSQQAGYGSPPPQPAAAPAQAGRAPSVTYLLWAAFLITGLVIGLLAGMLLFGDKETESEPTTIPAATVGAAAPTPAESVEAVLTSVPTPALTEVVAGPIPGVEIGQVAPDFVLQDLNGQEVKLGDLRGHIVVLTFWRMDDLESEMMMPSLKQFHREHKDDLDVALVTVNRGSTNEAVKLLASTNNWEFRILLDESSEKTGAYTIAFWPTTFFLDREGAIRDKFQGVLTPEELYTRASNLK